MNELKTVIAPVGCSMYLTESKEYEVINVINEHSFEIIDDFGCELKCHIEGCAHLNGGNWIIKKQKYYDQKEK